MAVKTRKKRRSLLTLGNPKTAKGESLGWQTAVLHYAPHTSAGVVVNGKVVNFCPAATLCIEPCLTTAGRGGIPTKDGSPNSIQQARTEKSHDLMLNRAEHVAELRRNIAAAARKAARDAFKPCFRLNGTSDLPFLPLTLAREFPQFQFYDYSKLPSAIERFKAGTLPPNYHVTFSQSGTNAADVLRAIKVGMNVAVVFDTRKGQPLPERYLGRPVIDGDAHDLRFLDPASPDGRGLIVGLRAKGRAKKDCSGFVVRTADAERAAA